VPSTDLEVVPSDVWLQGEADAAPRDARLPLMTRLGHCRLYLDATRSMPLASTTATASGPARNRRIAFAAFASLAFDPSPQPLLGMPLRSRQRD